MTDDCESWEAEQARVVSELRQKVERLTTALRDIMRHQECIGGDLAKIGATWRIAEKAVRDE